MEDDEILKYSMQIAMKYVRMLKEMNVAVYFEVEKIN